MTAAPLLAERLAERIAALPAVVRLYPAESVPRRVVRHLISTYQPLVRVHESDGRTEVLASVGVEGSVPAKETGAAIRSVIRDELDAAGVGDRSVLVRIATLD